MTAIETATTWLGGLGLASAYPARQSKLTSRPTMSPHQRPQLSRNERIRGEEYEDDGEDDDGDDASEYSADSYDSDEEEDGEDEEDVARNIIFTLPSVLPTDPQALTALLHQLNNMYQAQTSQLRRAYLESDALADNLQDSRDRERVLEARLRRSDGDAAIRGTGHLSRGIHSPPPLTPDLYSHDCEDSAFSSPSPSSLRTPSPSRHARSRFGNLGAEERDVSPARSVMSILSEEDEGFFSIPLTPSDGFGSRGKALGGGGENLGGLAVWDQNTRLKARVCELEEVVEGVLGMVG
jgi:hypothetical protein